MNILNHSLKRETIQLSILVLVFSFVYLVPISLIFQNPFSHHFSHGILILGISAYMVWTKKDRLRQAEIRPGVITGSFVALIASITMTAGAFSGTPLLEGISLVIGIFGMVWLLFGSSIIRIVAIPMSFLIFLFPIFDKTFRGYTDHLQLVAAFIGSILLEMTGLPTLQHGTLIQLPHITLEVGEACSGINHMIALMTLGVFLGYVTETRWFTKLIFVFMALVVGIIANGIRVALIGIWTKYFGTESFHGPFDIFYSSFVFFVGLVAVIFVRFVLLKHTSEKTTLNRDPNETNSKDQLDTKYFHLSFFIAAIILASTWTYQALARPLPFHLRQSPDEFTLNVKNWEGKKVDSLQEPYEFGNFDTKVKRIYYDQPGNQIKLFIGYLISQEQGENIDHYPYAINQNDTSPVQIQSNSSGIFRIKNAIYHSRVGVKQVYFWYDINGRVTGDRYRAKLATIMDAFLKRRTNAAVIILSTDIKEKNQERERENATLQFIKAILPLVQSSLSNVNE
ncbi:MAG: exosortase W [Deltaproteobacteria bacterium]